VTLPPHPDLSFLDFLKDLLRPLLTLSFIPIFYPSFTSQPFIFFLSARRFVDFQDKRRCRLGSISKSDFSSVFCLKEKGEPWPPFLLAGQCYTVVQKIRIGARDRPLLAVAGYDEASVPASVGSDHCSISMWAKRGTSRAVSHRKGLNSRFFS
jgi:hypothetical protein